MRSGFGEYFRKIPTYAWILGMIIVVGIFFRTYHFQDWLLFKGDAFRDAILVSRAYDIGPEALPLLGPRASGTMLRTGPIFYYFQYASAVIFQSLKAPVLAYPDLSFSILAVPMFYFLSRRFFSRTWSLALAALLAVSFMAVEYGRFAWNPNATLFFTLAFSYAVLRIYDAKPGTETRRGWWAAVAGVTLAIASQLHFSAFLGLPLVLFAFMLWRFRDTKRVLSWRIILIFLACVFLFYAPVFISDVFKHGENLRQFILAIRSKSSGGEGILHNMYQVWFVFGRYFIRIGLGIVNAGKTLSLLGGMAFIIGLVANGLLLRSEKDEEKRRFLIWALLIVAVYFILYIPLALKINRPRFFLPFMFVPYVYFAFVFVYLGRLRWYPRLVNAFACLGIIAIVFFNTHATLEFFSDLASSQTTRTALAKEKNIDWGVLWITWAHFERAAAIIEKSCENPGPVFFSVAKDIREFDHSFEYALIQNSQRIITGPKRSFPKASPLGCYYFISQSDHKLPDFVTDSARIDAPVDAGNIQVTRFYPKDMAGIYTGPQTNQKKTVYVKEKRKRYSRVYWADVLNEIRQ